MKYLKYELYKKVCSADGEQYEDEWNKEYSKFLKKFEQISSRLPKPFLLEFEKYYFHDNILNFVSIERITLKRGFKYVLTMHLLDYYNKNIIHNMVFLNVINFKSNLNFNVPAGNFDWMYCEILPVDEKHLSLEVALFDDSMLYFEFSKMRYKKVRL